MHVIVFVLIFPLNNIAQCTSRRRCLYVQKSPHCLYPMYRNVIYVAMEIVPIFDWQWSLSALLCRRPTTASFYASDVFNLSPRASRAAQHLSSPETQLATSDTCFAASLSAPSSLLSPGCLLPPCLPLTFHNSLKIVRRHYYVLFLSFPFWFSLNVTELTALV